MAARDEASLRPADERLAARADRLAGTDGARLWEALTRVAASPAWPHSDVVQAAALSNLAALALLGDAEDLLTLDALVRSAGHERVALVQARLDGLLDRDDDLPLTTAAMMLLGDRALLHKLLADTDLGEAKVAAVVDRVHRHAFWLLLSGPEEPGRAAPLRTVDDIGQVLFHGTARTWRAHLRPVMDTPWGPAGDRIVELARQAGGDVVAAALEECRTVYQERQEQREREAIAQEIRRLVALSGVSQRAFAAYIGTSPSRLSTYVNGRVVPSAALLLRIRHAAQALHDPGG